MPFDYVASKGISVVLDAAGSGDLEVVAGEPWKIVFWYGEGHGVLLCIVERIPEVVKESLACPL